MPVSQEAAQAKCLGRGASDAATRARLIVWTDEITAFADIAALIDNPGLVISVATLTPHLAAAMRNRPDARPLRGMLARSVWPGRQPVISRIASLPPVARCRA